MPELAPPIVMPVMVIGLFVPIVLFANIATDPLWSIVTMSFVSTPTSAAEVFTSWAVALVDAL